MHRSSFLSGKLMAAAIALIGTSAAWAQISVGTTGSTTESFDTQPPAANWSTGEMGTDHQYTTQDAQDAAVQTAAAASITAQVGNNTGNPPGTARTAQWSSPGHYLQTRPTGNGLIMLMATLRNDSGANITSLNIKYDLTIAVAPSSSTSEVIPGHRLYYSLTGNANEWVPIGNFGAAAGAQNPVADLTATPWTAGSMLYVLWVDNNATTNPDGAYDIDNVVINEVATIPPSITQQPAGTTNTEYSVVQLSVSATGSSPLTYQWYKGANPIAGATASSVVITNTDGSGHAWSVPADSGDYSVVVTGPVNPPATSATAHVVIRPDTNAPTFLYAVRETNAAGGTTFRITLSEPLTDITLLTNEVLNWAYRPAADPAGGPSSVSPDALASFSATQIDLIFNTIIPDGPYMLDYSGGPVFDRAASPNQLTTTSVPVYGFEAELLPMTASWKYDDAVTETTPAADWFSAAYDDSDSGIWKTGVGPFDAKKSANQTAGLDCRDNSLYSLGAVGTCIALTNSATGVENPMVFFRTHFNFSGAAPSNVVLRFNGKFDDFAVVYLNGTEVERVRIPSDASLNSLNRTNYGVAISSIGAVGDTDAQDTAIIVPGSLLHQGDNVIAVQVLQVNNTSSDMTMGLRVVAASITPLAAAGPRLSITQNGTDVTITWAPASGVLQFRDDADSGAWQDVTPAPAPGGPYTVTASAAHRYYSLRQ